MKAFYAKTPDEIPQGPFRMLRRKAFPASSTQRFCPRTMAEGYESWWHIGVASTSKSDEVKAARKRIDDHLAEARMY